MIEIRDETAVHLTYDGRNFLTQARQDLICCSPGLTQSVYSSEGVLLHGRSVKNILAGTFSKDTKVLYFAGRPVGLLEMTNSPRKKCQASLPPVRARGGSQGAGLLC